MPIILYCHFSRRPHGKHFNRQRKTLTGVSIGQYLVRRLCDYGVRDVFGIPGDYVLAFYALMESSLRLIGCTCELRRFCRRCLRAGQRHGRGLRDVLCGRALAFYAMMEKGPLRLIGCTREDCAGFAADAYARVNGIGAVCVTYCVGGLSLCNSIAGAYAEKSPVVVISGAPGLGERAEQPALAPQGQGFSDPGRCFPAVVRGRGPTERSQHRLPPHRPRAGTRRRVTSGRAISSCPATWSTSCRTGRTRSPSARRRATRTCWPRPWPRPSGGSPPPAVR